MNVEIQEFETVKAFFATLELKETDLIIVSDSVYKYYMSELSIDCAILRPKKYAVGEPDAEVLEIMRKDLPPGYTRIIAIGGGSIIDIAKIFALDFSGTVEDLFLGKTLFVKKADIIAVPGTCGAGSEVSNVSVVSLPRLQTKKGMAVDEMYPKTAVLIPELLEKLPYAVFATSSIDALVHAVESYLSPRATAHSRVFSLEAIGIIVSCYVKILADGLDTWKSYTREFILASNYAGIGFGNAGTAAVHALSYPLSGKYHIAHGEANQLMFMSVMNLYEKRSPDGDLQTLKDVLADIFQKEGNPIQMLGECLDGVLDRKPLSFYGINETEYEDFVESVVEGQQRLLKNNYVSLSFEELVECYQNCK